MRLGKAFQAERLSSATCLKAEKNGLASQGNKQGQNIWWYGEANRIKEKKKNQLERLKIDCKGCYMQSKTENFKATSQAYGSVAVGQIMDWCGERLMASLEVPLVWNAFLSSILPQTHLLKYQPLRLSLRLLLLLKFSLISLFSKNGIISLHFGTPIEIFCLFSLYYAFGRISL